MKIRGMKKLITSLLVLFALAWSYDASASHVAGADITYRCLGGDTYEIQLNVFRDCGGIGYGSTSVAITGVGTNCTSGGNRNISITLTKVTTPLIIAGDTISANGRGAFEVSQLCATALAQSRCKGSASYPGMEQYIFRGTVVLPAACNWTFYRNIVCCRNGNINLNSSSSSVAATLNNKIDTCNSSPKFAAQPIPYVCAGRTIVYNFGVTEPDGDSLVFAFDCGYQTYPNANIFSTPYSCTSPIPGITINSRNGKVTFTPTITGNWVIVVKVSEYDRATGTLIGTVLRDILVVVQTCNNNPPHTAQTAPSRPTPGTIYNFTGTGQLIDSVSVEVCIGETFNFDVLFSDPDNNDSLSLRTNITSIFPGATFSYTYPNAPSSYDTVIAHVAWTAVPVNGLFYPFFIEANDNACPIPALFYATFSVTIVESTYAGPDITICQNSQSANITVVGGNQFNWSALPGGSGISVPSNFSCDTCKNVSASPNVTTTYVVVSNLSSTCKNRDTITVRVVPDFTLTVTPDDTICNIDTFQLSALTSDPTQNYTYKWRPSQFLDWDTIANPKLSGLDISDVINVTVTSDSGCVKTEDINLTVALPFPPDIRAVATDTLICLSDTIDFDVELGTIPIKGGCGLSQFPCQGFANTITAVNGSLTTQNGTGVNQVPTPYAGAYASTRWQFLYHASDLQAQGMSAGRISAIGFDVKAMVGVNPFFNNFTIKMGCTNKRDLTTTWESNLYEVFTPKTAIIANGWNTHQLDYAYNWDGTSNLIVEVCFNNSTVSPPRSRNAGMGYTSTSYAASAMNTQWNADACGIFNQYFTSPYNALPNTQFTICSGVDPAGYQFSWASVPGNGGFITPTNMKDPSASVNLTTDSTYYLFIQDTLGVCFDTVSIDINVVDQYDVTPYVQEPFCITGGFQLMRAPTPWNILPRPNGGFWTGPGIINDSLGLFDPQLAGKGFHFITYSVTGDACANADSTQFEVVGLPDPSFNEGPFCELDAINLLDTNSVHIQGYFTSSIPGVVDSTTNNFDATVGNINPNGVDSIPVTYHAYNGCWHDTTIMVAVVEQFDATIGTFGPYCLNDDTVQLFAADAGGQWSGPGIVTLAGLFHPTIAGVGKHTITVDSTGFCGNTGTTEIDVIAIPVPEIIDPGPLCNDGGDWWGQKFEIFATQPGGMWGAPTTPPWMGFTDKAVFVPSAVVQVGGYNTYPLTYTLFDTIAPGKICAGTDTIGVIFNVSPPAPDVLDPFGFCDASFVEALFAPNPGAYEVLWFDNADSAKVKDAIAQGETLDVDSVVRVPMQYYIRHQDTAGCVSPPTVISYIIWPRPTADFDFDPSEGPYQVPVDVSFINKSEAASGDITIVKNRWMMFDYIPTGIVEDTSNLYTFPEVTFPQDTSETVYRSVDVAHSFPDNEHFGKYLVALYVESDKGCWDTIWKSILVDPLVIFEIPNVFTPPGKGKIGDDVNDTFLKEEFVLGLAEMEGVIYNRWGRKVFELTKDNPVWDGENHEDGVYFYKIRIKPLGAEAESSTFEGSVTLIREN